MKTRFALLATCMLTFGAVSGHAQAQQVEATDTFNSNEIVVTAQHRAENLQDVPIAITALSSQTLKDMGASTPQEVFAQLPAVHFQAPNGKVGFPIYNIRGVALLDFSYISESSIATYRDGIYQGNTGLGVVPLFDLERVEVLRGPQGTLYGRNATGGLINFISAQPTEAFHYNGTLQVGNFRDIIATAAISGPLSENVRGRIAARYQYNRGFQRNGLNGMHFGTIDGAIAVRGILDIDLSDDITVTLNAHYAHADGQSDLRNARGRKVPGTVPGPAPVDCSVADQFASICATNSGRVLPQISRRLAYTTESETPYFYNTGGASATINWDIGGITLTSITAYEHIKKNEYVDLASAGQYLFSYLDYFSTIHNQYSQELRLSGETGPLQWQVGGFFYWDDRLYTTGLPDLGIANSARQKIDSQAIFGQATYAVTDTINLTAGGRYTLDHKVISLRSGAAASNLYIPNQDVPGPQRPDFPYNDTLKDKSFTWRLAADWHPTEDVMVFASASTGYKLGGYNGTTVTTLAAAGPVKSETMLSYELGFKADLIDRMLTLNVTGYKSKWKNIQATVSVASSTGTAISTYYNIGDANIYGVEAELLFRPTDNLTINAGAAYTHNKLNSPPTITINGQSIDGNRLANSPKLGLNAAVSFEPEIGGGSRLLSGFDVNYQSKIFFRPDNVPEAVQPGYALVNARLGYAAPDNRFRIEAFSKNLFDKKYFTSGTILGNDILANYFGTPRTYGLRFSTNF